jgi:U3 small nucleolar RNA-associated protein MPP10
MFSLDDMENFLDEAEEEAEERRKVEDEEEDGDNDKERDSDEDDDSDDEGDIYRELSESDDDDDEAEDSEEADDLDDALAYTAKLAGVSASTRRIKDKKPKGKKAQDMMFEDFFGKHKGKPLGGTKGGKLGASTDAELNELSDEEEDMFNELEGDEDLDEEDDDLDGELETGIAGNRGLENHDDDKDEYMEEDEEDEEDEELDIGGDTEMDALDKQLDAQLDAEIARAEQEGDYEKDEEDDMPAQPNAKSAFQRQQDALARQMDKLESAALGEKSWLLKGEADAKQRPLNSALETDLEFEHVMAPAPVISAEITQKLEDIIKQRIIEGRFDDVERIEPVQERERKEAPQLDDTKSSKGLGEIYADEYMKQKVGVALGEKEDPIVAEVKKLWALLSYRLDALSRTGFVEEPKDIEARIDRELALRAQGNLVPATFNETTHQAPEEIFAGGDGKGGQRGSAAGNVKADDELTKEERKAGRAKRKRKSKAAREERDRVKSQRDRQREAQLKAEEEAGFTRKAPKVAMLAAAPAGGKSKSVFSKSSKVFGLLHEAKEADAARGGPLKKSKSDSTKNKSSLKL